MAVSRLGSLFGRFWETAFGYAVGGSAAAIVDPIVTPLAEEGWVAAVAAGDGRALNPADLAAMAVQGVMDERDAAGEAAKSGLTSDAFHRLFLVNGSPIAPEQALELWNRGEISEADVNRALLQSRLKPEWVDDFKKLRRQILQLADLAEMVVQTVLGADDARRRALQLGIDGDDFDRLVLLAGNPPGPETVLEMWNRGIISEPDATLALRQSRLKPQWIETFKQTRIRPASVSQAVSAVVKERIPPERGREIAAENGVAADTFDLLVDEAGRPISITEALQLLRRGKIDEARFREVVARSDVKTEFTADLLNLKENLPSLAQMRAIIGTGALSDDVARRILQMGGYADDVIAGIVAAGHGDKLAGTKLLTQSAILSSYTAQQMDRTTAAQLLAGLGYDANDAGVLLGYADYQRDHTYRTAVVSVVRARYLQRDIDDSTAGTLLDQAGIPPAERDQYLALWKFDVDANPHLLTLAQLTALYTAGIVTAADFAAYLPRLGYVDPELTWLVQLHTTA